MKTHLKLMHFCRYELGPFSSSFVLRPLFPFKSASDKNFETSRNKKSEPGQFLVSLTNYYSNNAVLITIKLSVYEGLADLEKDFSTDQLQFNRKKIIISVNDVIYTDRIIRNDSS